MLRTLVIIAVFFPLAACGEQQAQPAPGAPQAEAIDPFNLHIEIGRYGAMMGQVRDHTAETPNAAPEEDVADPIVLARRLRETAWEYNMLASQLCSRGLFAEQTCGPAFNPVWLADPADASVSLEEIETRKEALGDQVLPLWNAVCEQARQGVPEEEQMMVCPME